LQEVQSKLAVIWEYIQDLGLSLEETTGLLEELWLVYSWLQQNPNLQKGNVITMPEKSIRIKLYVKGLMFRYQAPKEPVYYGLSERGKTLLGIIQGVPSDQPIPVNVWLPKGGEYPRDYHQRHAHGKHPCSQAGISALYSCGSCKGCQRFGYTDCRELWELVCEQSTGFEQLPGCTYYDPINAVVDKQPSPL
jgi:hypothetical protein